jgi:hypothetical protein
MPWPAPSFCIPCKYTLERYEQCSMAVGNCTEMVVQHTPASFACHDHSVCAAAYAMVGQLLSETSSCMEIVSAHRVSHADCPLLLTSSDGNANEHQYLTEPMKYGGKISTPVQVGRVTSFGIYLSHKWGCFTFDFFYACAEVCKLCRYKPAA